MNNHIRSQPGADDEIPSESQYQGSRRSSNSNSNVRGKRLRSRSPERRSNENGNYHDERDLKPGQINHFEEDRRARMARLRAQNEEEEKRLELMDRNEEEKRVAQKRAKRAKEEILTFDPKELEGLDEDEQMQRLLGFSGFASTKGTEVEGNKTTAAKGAATKNKARKYRQYMNRKGGFNRPLDKMD